MKSTPEKTQGGLMCVALGLSGLEETVRAAEEVKDVADVIEVRLDSLTDPDVLYLADRIATPLLFTCRPEWEGGLYTGDEERRIDLLEQAVHCGAAYIDLELLAPDSSHERLLLLLENAATRLILSNHSFKSTPTASELSLVVQRMKERGADIGKIVTMAHDHRDALRVLQLQREADELDMSLIAFCMGKAGIITRLATLELGGFMTYCTLAEQEGTAPGQIPIRTLRQVLMELGLGSATAASPGSEDRI